MYVIKELKPKAKMKFSSRAQDDIFILLASMLDLLINEYVILNLITELC